MSSFRAYDLEDLSTIELNDGFIEKHLQTGAAEGYSRQALQEVCESFVKTFLCDQAESLTTLHASLSEFSSVLQEMEGVLEGFIVQLDAIQTDMGDVRDALASTTIQLANRKAAENILWAAVSHLVVPPEVVQVVTCSSEEQLGVQFKMCVAELLKYLNHRKGTWMKHTPDPSSRALREVRFSLADCRAYSDLMAVLDSLTVFACLKIKSFLSKKLMVLTVKNTNAAIQQENVLKPFSFYTHFLRSAVPLLRHTHGAERSGNTLMAFRIVRSLYSEFKSEYCTIMSQLYLEKIQEYVMICNSMEYATTAVTSGGSGNSPGYAYRIPLITESSPDAAEALRLRERRSIFNRTFASPLIPTIERAHKRQHTYEETFRSVLNLVCDIVTHEYLFTFTFFLGDMSVYAEVFKSSVQFIIDYVAEVVLASTSGAVSRMLNERPRTAVNRAGDDTYGLLILICLCQEYGMMMKYTRKLSCLDGFFDSLLRLLWPAFKRAFEKQLIALRCTQPTALLLPMKHMRLAEEKLRYLHPLVRCFSELSCSIYSLVLGVMLREEQLVAEVVSITEQSDGGASHLGTPAGRSPTSETFSMDGMDVGSRQWNSAIRLRALHRIASEEADSADASGEFEALLGKLSFMRVEIVHVLDSISSQMIMAEPDTSQLRHLRLGFVLNGLYYMLHKLRSGLIVSEDAVTIGQRADLSDLTESYDRYRGEFVARLLDMHFPQLVGVVQGAESYPAADALRAADQAVLHWKGSLDAMRDTVHRIISDPSNEQEIIAQACMDCLLYNTRFHSALAKHMETSPDVFDGRPLRSMIVTNQLLLQHMRTFSTAVPTQNDGM